jgi:hypothetical protein
MGLFDRTEPDGPEPPDPAMCLWRTGRKVGRTIYVQVGPQASDDDPLIGMMDSPVLADMVVSAHNLIVMTLRDRGRCERCGREFGEFGRADAHGPGFCIDRRTP